MEKDKWFNHFSKKICNDYITTTQSQLQNKENHHRFLKNQYVKTIIYCNQVRFIQQCKAEQLKINQHNSP